MGLTLLSSSLALAKVRCKSTSRASRQELLPITKFSLKIFIRFLGLGCSSVGNHVLSMYKTLAP